jgi:hypothetical protein
MLVEEIAFTTTSRAMEDCSFSLYLVWAKPPYVLQEICLWEDEVVPDTFFIFTRSIKDPFV